MLRVRRRHPPARQMPQEGGWMAGWRQQAGMLAGR